MRAASLQAKGEVELFCCAQDERKRERERFESRDVASPPDKIAHFHVKGLLLRER